ncbi:translation elongation factor 2 [Marasmius tenuissimus]|uniref:Translation elongation factor 2 n=1 Tax=Marasmius tenuissimus TaxID=585030 RepID=A0ABR3AB14_9AGAR
MLVKALLCLAISPLAVSSLSLTQQQEQVFRDRLYQTNLRGPRYTGNDNQNTLTELVAASMKNAGLDVQTLTYDFTRWDARWWSLSLKLKNGTVMGLSTTGYWPYSGDSGLTGRTGPIHDAGTFGILDNLDRAADTSTLDLDDLVEGSVLFFDNPSPTRNYSLPEYRLLGTSRNISRSEIPELGNLTNPHWQSTKKLDWDDLKDRGVIAAISSWVNVSDENAALQFLPNDGAPGDGNLYDVPALYVGNTTGDLIRKLVREGKVDTATLVLDAPSSKATTSTVIGHLKGRGASSDTIVLYTHSDGPTIVEENGPILLLAMAEALASRGLDINIDFVITTGHLSGGHVNESLWKDQVPSILRNAKVVISCEHFGAIEYKDTYKDGKLVYAPTGKLEPMWTMTNDTNHSDVVQKLYLESFEGTSDLLRMALLAAQRVKRKLAKWFGVGGIAQIGHSKIPALGIIPQPDYLWAAFPDGGWSKLNISIAIEQVNVILTLVEKLNAKHVSGEL